MWLDLSFIKGVLDKEVENEIVLQEMPYYFIEMCQILFNKAEDDINEYKQIKSIIEDLSTIRNGKIMKILETLQNVENQTLKINNICAREVENIRSLLTEVYNKKLQVVNVHKYHENHNQSNHNEVNGGNQNFIGSQDFS